jgi:hypothetical protein
VTTRANPWDGDWEKRIYDRVRARNFASLTEFADAQPHASYRELTKDLGDDVAIVQLETLLRDEAKKHGRAERFARSSLVRLLREYCADGWDCGDNFKFRAARAFASWVSTLGVGYESAAERTWGLLKSRRPPKGWCPDNPDDPLLKDVFGEALFGEEARA